MKLNLKIRLKNKTFILSMLITIVAFVYQILGQLEIVLKVMQNEVTQIILFIVNILAGL